MYKARGFTIVELLIVIVVIGILAAISIVAYNGVSEKARDSERRADAASIAKGLTMWSSETGKLFSQMNGGNGSSVDNGANGWFDAGYYATPSTRTILENSGYIGKGIDDPRRSASEPSRWRYLVAPCTSDVSDNRRLVLMELERAPDEPIAQQVSTLGCNSSYISSYTASYRVNYVRMADAR
ncbi:hypothetical protein B7Y94_01490 [Candidatus Saccharibacteria bacterium 32-49-12]|nr:MAG: hypothetical protein B7Y94_01490 [Candidatus Saccharibacteria bacterium 32-49-12]